MRRLILLLLATLQFIPLSGHAGELDPALLAALQNSSGEIAVIVRLNAQADTASLAAEMQDRRGLRAEVVRRLRKVAADSQAPLRTFLAARGVNKVDSLVLINALAFRASPALISEIVARPEVERISLDGSVPPPEIMPPVVVPAAVVPSAASSWNLDEVNVPALWNMGYRGQGTVVAILDSGVNPNHQELTGKYLNNGHSWFDPYTGTATPYDFPSDLGLYHGTAVMSLLVGATVGVAPEAKWIAAKIFPDTGDASFSAIHLAFDWVLDPDGDPATIDDDPDVVNNSWALDIVNQCDTEFQVDAQRLRDAGIAVVFAGGNFGNGGMPNTSASPGNNFGNLAVGMVDSSLVIDPDSSQGPSPCDSAGSVYPELVAPGVDILVADGPSNNAYASVAGTSFSAPQVAGVIALLKQAVPLAVGSGLERAVLESSRLRDLGVVGPDNVYGNGMLDALNAYDNLIIVDRPPTAPVPVSPADGATGLNAGNVTLNWMPGSDPDGEVVRTRISLGTDPGLSASTPVWVAAAAFDPRIRLAAAGLLGAGLALAGLWRRRKRLLAATLLGIGAAALLSCGGGGGGGSSPPALPSYSPPGLAAGMTYYWRVDSIDERGKVTTGPVSSFTTAP